MTIKKLNKHLSYEIIEEEETNTFELYAKAIFNMVFAFFFAFFPSAMILIVVVMVGDLFNWDFNFLGFLVPVSYGFGYLLVLNMCHKGDPIERSTKLVKSVRWIAK